MFRHAAVRRPVLTKRNGRAERERTEWEEGGRPDAWPGEVRYHPMRCSVLMWVKVRYHPMRCFGTDVGEVRYHPMRCSVNSAICYALSGTDRAIWVWDVWYWPTACGATTYRYGATRAQVGWYAGDG
eukprot:1825263-Rhodomonas_salina.1